MENNPAQMTNEDLEKDMQSDAKSNATGNQENVNKSTAAEGTLKSPEDISSAVSHHTSYNAGEEQDLDDLVHRRAEEESDGNLPNPEDIPAWEGEDDDDKITG
jgi:hypothetical protein